MADTPATKPAPRARSKRAGEPAAPRQAPAAPDKLESGDPESGQPETGHPESGHPESGKPVRRKRSGKTLGDDFVAAVRADFRDHGASVIASVREDKPDQYLKIVLSVLPKDMPKDLPKDLNVTINSLDALSDDEIRRRIRSLEAVLRPFLADGGDDPGAPGGRGGLSGAAQGAGSPATH
jgi:hypothetical protein